MKKQRPFNALFDPRTNQDFTTSKRAEEIMGRRKELLKPGHVAFDQPCELGYHCPVCKYPQLTDGTYDERLTWSEYNGFLFCYVCNRDYPSCLCLLYDIGRAIEIFLESVEQAKKL